MTKKEEKAARVEAGKRAAYVRKVRSLIGWAGERQTNEDLINGYLAKIPAEEYAAAVCAREPVGAAVWPAKIDAVRFARERTLKTAQDISQQLETVNFDLGAIAPKPTHQERWTSKGKIMNEHRSHYLRWAEFVDPRAEDDVVRMSQKYVDRNVRNAEEDTAALYDAFVCKLVRKIGPGVSSASLEGNHVWSHSTLTVAKGALVERWYTQQITNCSVLGLYFPQWPTRLLKGGAK